MLAFRSADAQHADSPHSGAAEAVALGTSIMAATFKHGVILGADSRTTTGSYIANRVSDKLTPLHDHIMCCRSGSAADTQALCDAARYQLGLLAMTAGRGTVPRVKWAAEITSRMCYENREQLQAGLIVAGWDAESGAGSVYNIPLGGSLHKQPFAIGGSGSAYIYGWCDANWRDGMEAEEAVAFVTTALSLAMSRDGSSGGVIRLAIITQGGVERRTIRPHQQPIF